MNPCGGAVFRADNTEGAERQKRTRVDTFEKCDIIISSLMKLLTKFALRASEVILR